MKDAITNLAAGVLVALGFAVLVVLGSIWGGFVLSTLWNWYAAPFTAVRLTIPFAIGLGCLIAALKGVYYRKSESGDSWPEAAYGLIAPGLLLLVGWVAHHYV